MTFKTLAAAAVLSLASLPAFAEIMIHDAYARSASPSARSGAAFMHIMNTSDAPDRLISASSDAAKRVELHTHVMQDGIAHMMQVEEGFEIPASGAAYLERGGNHVMMMGLTAPFVPGETISITFTFEIAGEITLDVVIDNERMTQSMGDMDHQMGEGADHHSGEGSDHHAGEGMTHDGVAGMDSN